MEQKHLSPLTRIFDLIVGLAYLVFADLVIFFPSIGFITLLVILSVILIVTGFIEMYRGFAGEQFSRKSRTLDLIFGFVNLLLGIVVLFSQSAGAFLMAVYLSFAMLFIGIGFLYEAFEHSYVKTWARVLYGLGGLLSLVFAVYDLFVPSSAVGTLILLLAFGFVFLGFAYLASGITGHKQYDYV